MSTTTSISNTFIRDGSSQQQRALPAQQASYAPLDQRNIPALLNFLYRYARYVVYYDDSNSITAPAMAGNWQDFLAYNAPFQYAAIHEFALDDMKAAYDAARQEVDQQTATGLLQPVINRVLALVLQLNTWYDSLDTSTNLYGVLNTFVQNDFSKALAKVIAIYNTMPGNEDGLLYDVRPFTATWGIGPSQAMAYNTYLQRLTAYPRRQRQYALQQLDELFNIFYKGIQQLQQVADSDFQTAITANANHTPHTGLLYAFLDVFQLVKNNMNGITERHMDFFYREILDLNENASTPDYAHIIVTLAKDVQTQLLAAGTPLKAGKDALGKDVQFSVRDDVVINAALVNQLRTLYKDDNSNVYAAPVASSADGKGTAFQDPAYNSWPTLGAAQGVNKNSSTGATQTYPLASTGLLIASPALLLREGNREVTLLLQLQLSDTDAQDLLTPTAAARWQGLFTISYSSDKGWVTLNDPAMKEPIPAPTYTFGKVGSSYQWGITFSLGPKAPALLPADAKALGVNYPVTDPVVRIRFNQAYLHDADHSHPWYDILSKAPLLSTNVYVKATQIKNLLISNNNGVLDPNKSFQPFSAVPAVGSQFLIGSDEIFRKQVTGLQLNVQWDGFEKPAGQNLNLATYYQGYPQAPANSSFTTKIEKLSDGQWSAVSGISPLVLFPDAGAATTPGFKNIVIKTLPAPNSGATVIDIPQRKDASPLAPYTGASVNGFIRLTLTPQDFQHSQYATVLTNAMRAMGGVDVHAIQQQLGTEITNLNTSANNLNSFVQTTNWALINTNSPDYLQLSTAKGNATAAATISPILTSQINALYATANQVVTALPNPPYTPAVKDFSIDYTAAASGPEVSLLHLYPFEESNYNDNVTTLLPVADSQGCLLVGLTGAKPGSNVNLLFQLAEYTANPDIPQAQLTWQYLRGNDWITLRPDLDIISDATQGLIVSGIITIALPWDADTMHTILPSAYHWLRVITQAYTPAVCEAITVQAQAAKTVYTPTTLNDPNRLATPLAPSTISALVQPMATIKKISQDYASFGGRVQETTPNFYRRVSERLRHKGRAINIYDYERMVLEQFPAIRKVKCIPHMKMCQEDPANPTPLAAPGWVSLAVIPDIAGLPLNGREQPRASRILLAQIMEYLEARCSGFVQVQVINPDFQEVNFQGNIRLVKGKDENYYLAQLQQEVLQFLCPWILQQGQEAVFGANLMMSYVLQFIEQRPYVEFVTDFLMYGKDNIPVKVITAETPWSVLVPGTQTYTALQTDCCDTSTPVLTNNIQN